MAKAKIERTQKLFLKAMKEKFAEDPQATSTVFAREGLEQSPRKMEFLKEGQKVAMERGISIMTRSAATVVVSRSASAS